MNLGDPVRVMLVHDPLDPVRGWEIVTAEVVGFIGSGAVRVRTADGHEWTEFLDRLVAA